MPRPLAIATVLALVVIALLLYIALRPPPAVDALAAGAEEDHAALLERGRYLVTAANCASCHTVAGGEFMAGGVAFETPYGRLYSTNITPDPETGIGAWSRQDFVASMRHGVRPGGEHLYPAFPYTAFTRISDSDLAAMHAYLQAVPPVRREAPPNDMRFPFNLRPLLAFWKLLYLRPGAFEPDGEQSARWNRGAYLVEALAHCSACHTPRGLLGAEKPASHFGGGEYLDRVPGGGSRPWSAPNLTAGERGLGLWTEEELARYLESGRNGFLEAFGPMNEVIMNSTRYLEATDIRAMAGYLKSLPAVAEEAGEAPASELMGRGRTIYNLHCGTCHLPSGSGDPEMAPRLASGSLVVQADNPASLINTILYGPELAESGVPPHWLKPMAAYAHELDDEELAAVATFVRNAWDNRAGLVTPSQVARQRRGH